MGNERKHVYCSYLPEKFLHIATHTSGQGNGVNRLILEKISDLEFLVTINKKVVKLNTSILGDIPKTNNRNHYPRPFVYNCKNRDKHFPFSYKFTILSKNEVFVEDRGWTSSIILGNRWNKDKISFVDQNEKLIIVPEVMLLNGPKTATMFYNYDLDCTLE